MLTLAELIDAQAVRRPDQAFLTFDGRTTTFVELQRQVRRAAAALHHAGFASGQRVMIMMGNRPQHAITYFALAAVGCVVVEASIHFRRNGIALQLEDADPHHLIVDPVHVDDAAAALQGLGRDRPITTLTPTEHPKTRHVDLDRDLTAVDLPTPSLERVQAISYTSGTTGRPKGVMLTERFFRWAPRTQRCWPMSGRRTSCSCGSRSTTSPPG
jgi:crotonobetaine/carnitine-CoA ligase